MIVCANMGVTMSNKSGSGGVRVVGWQESRTVIRFQISGYITVTAHSTLYTYMYMLH